MPDPVFTEADRVAAANATLPSELQGKSAAEVAAYYQQRETRLQADLRTAQAAATPAPITRVEVKTPKNEDFWTDPAGSVVTAIKAQSITREEFNNASEFVRKNMTEVAEFLVSQRHEDWKVFKADIDDIMKQVEPAARADSSMWETAYIYARGRKPELAVKASTVVIPTNGAERGSPAAAAVNTVEPDLTGEQEYVRSRLGISKKEYTEAQKNIASGTWFTVDNRPVERR